MKLAAICCTYKRPELLEIAIESFLRQEHPANQRELIVLDDSGQYASQTGEGWRLLSIASRFRTLGEKRNASAALASPDVDAYCVWDDDDVYLPWHMSAASAALEQSDFAIPSSLFVQSTDGVSRVENKARIFHGSWSYRRSAFAAVRGYEFMQSGEDQELHARFRKRGLRCGNPLEFDPRPSYLYRWFTAHESHLSHLGAEGYAALGDSPFERVESLRPRWECDWVQFVESAR